MSLRVALVHDKIWQLGGSERVVLALRDVWPDADIFTSAFNPRLVQEHGFGDVRSTFLQRVPRLHRAHHYFLPFYELAFRGLRLQGYDVVISSSSMFSKCVRPRDAPHVCYCHTPIRLLWADDATVAELPNSLPTKLAVRAMIPWLRQVDRRAADRVDRFVANSSFVSQRIRDCYGRDSTVIYPPVDIEAFAGEHPRGDYLVVVARLFPYKRVDTVIEACNALRTPLVVVGEGPDRARLEALAGPTVQFEGWVEQGEVPALVGGARALVAPQLEDFGIAMVEAAAAGTPVLAYGEGGAREIVDAGVSGLFFEKQTVDALVGAIRALDSYRFDRAAMRTRAQRFSRERFAGEMRALVEAAVR